MVKTPSEKAEELLLDFLVSYKYYINFEALLAKNLLLESDKLKYLSILVICTKADFSIVDINLRTNKNLSGVLCYFYPRAPQSNDSLSKLLLFHDWVVNKSAFPFSSERDLYLLNNLFKYTKSPALLNKHYASNTFSLSINCGLSSIELINLLSLLNE